MANVDLGNALRQVLNNYGMLNPQIEGAIAAQIQEATVGAQFPAVVAALGHPNNVAFTAAFNAAIAGVDGVWNDPLWNLAPLGLTGPLAMVAGEECNAISHYGPTPGFDAVKALTNMLRMINVAV